MYLLFDIGGSKMRFATARDLYTFDPPQIFDTPQDFEEGMLFIEQLILKYCGGEKPQALVAGIAGPLSADHSRLVQAPHLTSWVGQPILERLKAISGTPVYLENDTALVGLGEAVDGAGKNGKIVAYLTVSTGVGGVRIVEREIDRATYGFEPGHQIIQFEGKTCPGCQGQGHLEAYISGTAVERITGKKPYDIHDELFWEEQAKYLAYGLNNTILHWSPDTVVIGGSMMKKVGIPLDRVSVHLKELMKIFPTLPELHLAALGDFGGLHGGLAYLRRFE